MYTRNYKRIKQMHSVRIQYTLIHSLVPMNPSLYLQIPRNVSVLISCFTYDQKLSYFIFLNIKLLERNLKS